MARLVKQFRYYGETSPLNYPENVTYAALATGNIFSKTPVILISTINTADNSASKLKNATN